jgi:peptide/nickel transport system ATP-binding protein
MLALFKKVKTMSDSILKVENVTKIFRYGFLGFKFKAVDDVSITIENKPLIFTIAGESGSGKTTLAKLILRIYRPEQGRILFMGRNIYEIDEDLFHKNVQPIMQDPYASFNPMQKPIRYLKETARNIAGIKDEKEVEEYVAKTLTYVGLNASEIIDKYPHEFSGGELQRLAVARALLPRPKIIIADEPVSMLDASLRINVINLFKKIKDDLGIAFIYITHDLATAYYMSDKIAIMFRGTVIESGESKRVLSKPLHPYTQALLESLPEPDSRKRKQWIEKRIRFSAYIEEEEFIAKGCKYVFRCPYAMDKCKTVVPPYIRVNDTEVRCWLYEAK